MAKKVKYVCSRCGSDDVVRDAYAVWSIDEQDWVLDGAVFDAAVCNSDKCEGNECSLKEVDVE
jgi:ribosomal protein L37AE/L43A